jgi:hypothetical protein
MVVVILKVRGWRSANSRPGVAAVPCNVVLIIQSQPETLVTWMHESGTAAVRS